MIRCLAFAFTAIFKSRARLVAESLCLRQQLIGFEVCARTVARYMQRPYSGTPSPGWRQFLGQHGDEI